MTSHGHTLGINNRFHADLFEQDFLYIIIKKAGLFNKPFSFTAEDYIQNFLSENVAAVYSLKIRLASEEGPDQYKSRIEFHIYFPVARYN